MSTEINFLWSCQLPDVEKLSLLEEGFLLQ